MSSFCIEGICSNMDTLCEDIERHIVGFCDLHSIDNLRKVSKVWKKASNEGRIYESGPINGSTFSQDTFKQHGSIFMPFITEVKLLESWATDDIREALESLHLPKISKKRSMTLHVNQAFLQACEPDVLNILTRIFWFNIVCHDGSNLNYFRTENANVGAASLLQSSQFIVSNELTLIYYGNSQDISTRMTQKAFSMNTKALVLYGVLTDMAMSSILAVNHSLSRLVLINEGCCDWYNAKCLQRACPNLKQFSIMSSNLLDSDLDSFNWTLWPNLTSLNLEHNFTMRGQQISWPSNLEELYVAFTGIKTPEALPTCSSLKQFSCNLQLSDAWFSYITSKKLRAISVSMKEFFNEAREFAFWTSVNQLSRIDKITIHHMEGYVSTNNVKKACPKSIVIKRCPIHMQGI